MEQGVGLGEGWCMSMRRLGCLKRCFHILWKGLNDPFPTFNKMFFNMNDAFPVFNILLKGVNDAFTTFLILLKP